MSNAEHKLATEMRAAQVLKAALSEYADDHDLIANSIEGETSLHEAIGYVMDGITEDEMMVAGLRTMVEQIVNRRLRIEARIDRRRAAIERAMAIGELPKLELPRATLSLRKVPPKVEILDEAALPESALVPQPPKPDKGKLKELLESGVSVIGARMTNGGQTLVVKRA